MSTLPGLASKGEKGKSKFQSLDINHLYKVYTGESLETQQQKNTIPRKHGMQSLGKVPTARRPPANLPSIKSEHTGSDAAVSLVPSGGVGWGKQDQNSPSTNVPSVPTATVTTSPPLVQQNAPPVNALPVTNSVPSSNKTHITPSATPVTSDKSWSSVMSGADLLQPPPYQSPQFQHEFPSLSAGDGALPRTGVDTQYGPGPSLRPQTEGSWIQGGSRPGIEPPPRSNSAPLGPPPQLSVPVGQNQPPQQPLPPQFRGLIPPFMFRGNNFPANGHGGSNFSNAPGTAASNGRNRMTDNRGAARTNEGDEVCHRPIIKEEDLNRMDDMIRDVGWASHDDIDYNQTLAFSDDEQDTDKIHKQPTHKEHDKTESSVQEPNVKNWSAPKNQPATSAPPQQQQNRNRSSEEEEVWVQRRRQQSEEVAIVIERAKQRKEEEEKRFLEIKQAAAKKLQQLDEKSKNKHDKEVDDTQGTISPSVVPPQPINPVPIPVPDWEKEKEQPRTPVENNKQFRENTEFRKLTQIEGRNFVRKETRSSDPRDAPSFSKQFQSNLPPRFQRQQQMRNNVSPSPQPVQSAFMDQYEMPWQNQFNKPRKSREDDDKEEDDRRDTRKMSNEDSYRFRSFNDASHKIDEEREFDYRKEVPKQDDHSISRQSSEDNRFERPQRPDSRDSRASRESRHSRESEPRDFHGSWADTPFEPVFDDRRKEQFRDDRRAVPGPITKERIEAAEDLKPEKKNLTQLKRGYAQQEKRIVECKKEKVIEKDDDWEEVKVNESAKKGESVVNSVWAEPTPNSSEVLKEIADEKSEVKKEEENVEDLTQKMDNEKDDKRNVNPNQRRGDLRHHQPWASSSCVYHRSTWSKKSDSRRGSRNGAPKRIPSNKPGGEWHGTDSDVSVEDVSVSTESGKDDRSRSSFKKGDKEEKNKEMKQEKVLNSDRKYDFNRRDNYVPRGEPSKHGRGGGNFRSRGGLGKRIDGYGPPPSKSPFSQVDDKEKKINNEDGAISNTSSDEKTKQNRSQSPMGTVPFKDKKLDDMKSKSTKKPKSDDNSNDNCDTSDNSEDGQKSRKFGVKSAPPMRSSAANLNRRTNHAPRFANDKRPTYNTSRQNISGPPKYGVKKEKDEKSESVKTEAIEDDCPDEDGPMISDSDGFQEVKNKKTVQRQKPFEEKSNVRPTVKNERDNKLPDRKKPPTPHLTAQQIANIPSLMDTPINPPVIVPQTTNKNMFDRKLPPRFAKQRENRMQKVHMQQGVCDVNEMNKVNHNINVYGIKDGQCMSSGRMSNAWEKPLSTHLRTDQEGMLTVGMDSSKAIEPLTASSQSTSPNIDKVMKSTHVSEKTVLDGTTPPVNTIIFENTNFKSAPGARSGRTDKSCPKLDDAGIEQAVISTFNKPMRDLLNKNEKPSDSMQMQLSFGKEDSADMKLDFFESELSHLTEDKNGKNMGLPRSMHMTSANNTISASTADALNFKIASVKKVWETTPTVIEHSVGQDDSNSSFSTSFGPDPNSLDPSGFGKSGDGTDDGHEVYNSSSNQPTTNNTTNVCKVKPTQQVTGTSGQQPVHSASSHQQHSAIGPSIVGHTLSPPPMQAVLGAGVGLGQPPQPYTSNQHLGYQPNLGGSTQYGMSAIPSPPTVLFNSTQQIQAAPTGLYGTFQIDQSQVLGGQGRSQYSPYPNPYNLSQTASSPYSAQSMYLQGAQPHPSAAQAPPDIYQNLNNYRLPASGHFGQSQQMNNPTTVLISSTSNTLMSATVKPSTQQISAIGTKASGGGQAYQQSQQGQQLYMTYDAPIQANYLQSAGVIQRGPTAPIQNNVVPTIQPSSSFYTGSTGGQTGYYQQPGSSTLQSAPLQQHQAGYGLQGNVFGNPNQSHTSASLQNYSSHFLSSPIQLAAAAALNAQQYRSTGLQNSAYVKSVNNHMEQNSRPQQIKSPGSQQDVLSSVFNSGAQIPSPKSRQNIKQPAPQASPTTQHKYLYQAVGNPPPSQTQRYPSPIQRPVNFHTAVGGMPNNGGSSNNPKHRTANQNNKLAARHYYGGQGGNLATSQSDKGDDSKLGDNATSSTNSVNNTSSLASKAVNSNTATTVPTDLSKEVPKDDANVIKD
ncbi:hypothetical protein PPYR_06172 [Photinus pyralis]|uniref:BAT2 N-terminal domain-containing protein n=1 Tax=Photinus pyralis TaxID=7054 RepID=A0A1Y1KZ61_PHOPY|nr:protein PRRC2C [Photinus pyralis]XP_031338741.1 protein PRRC2C [Photinus pyralis]KAB0800432.1 hypothetical protein PPYR_06172 [Photinus pyralis]